MNNIKLYTEFVSESLGVDQNLIEQARGFFNQMLDNRDTNKFEFVYKNNKGETPFTVVIKPGSDKSLGSYNKYRNIIKLHNFDFSTLVHELQHLDHNIRTGGNEDNFKKFKDNLISHFPRDKSGLLHHILYLFDYNEFKSRYLDFYNDVDRNIKEIIDNNKGITITKDLINSIIKRNILDNDSLFIYYYIGKVNNNVFDFIKELDKGETDKSINGQIYSVIKGGYIADITFKSFLLSLKSLYIDPAIIKFDMYNKKDRGLIERTKEGINEMVQKRADKYRKKLNRVYSLMYDKYL